MNKEILDPFDEENWDEVDYQFMIQYGYYFDHLTKQIIVEKFKVGRIYNGDVEILEENSSKNTIQNLINKKIRHNCKIDETNLKIYKDIKRNFKIKDTFKGFKICKDLFFGNNIKNYFINPFKEYTIDINLTNYIITISKSKGYKIQKESDYDVYSNINNIGIRFNFFNVNKFQIFENVFLRKINDIIVFIEKRKNHHQVGKYYDYKMFID